MVKVSYRMNFKTGLKKGLSISTEIQYPTLEIARERVKEMESKKVYRECLIGGKYTISDIMITLVP